MGEVCVSGYEWMDDLNDARSLQKLEVDAKPESRKNLPLILVARGEDQ